MVRTMIGSFFKRVTADCLDYDSIDSFALSYVGGSNLSKRSDLVDQTVLT